MKKNNPSDERRKSTVAVQDIDREKLLAKVLYDRSTGNFYWRSKGKESKPLGYVNYDGYIRLYALGRRFYAHRLAWFYVTGDWPGNEIDHRNGIRGDNRFRNLRCATRKENCANSALHDKEKKIVRPKYKRR